MLDGWQLSIGAKRIDLSYASTVVREDTKPSGARSGVALSDLYVARLEGRL